MAQGSSSNPPDFVSEVSVAQSQWDLSKASVLALAAIAQQTCDLKTTLDNVVVPTELALEQRRQPSPPPPKTAGAVPNDAINVAATINSGSIGAAVTISSLSEEVLSEVDKRLSKAARAAFSFLPHLDHRIECFSAALDCSIDRFRGSIDCLGEEICKSRAHVTEQLCRLVDEIGCLRRDICNALSCIESRACEIKTQELTLVTHVEHRLLALQNNYENIRVRVEGLESATVARFAADDGAVSIATDGIQARGKTPHPKT